MFLKKKRRNREVVKTYFKTKGFLVNDRDIQIILNQFKIARHISKPVLYQFILNVQNE